MQENNNQQKIYNIPVNFRDSGKIMNGMISTRNAIDAAVLALFGAFIASLLPVEGTGAISTYILLMGGFGMFGIIGIKGDPLSVYVADILRWRKRRKPFLYNTHSGAYSMSAADLMLSEKQFRDMLADTIDELKNSMTKKAPEYVEGQNFEFAADPELEALKDAEAERQENAEKLQQEDQSDAETPAAHKDEQNTNELNIDGILGNIVLSDVEKGGD